MNGEQQQLGSSLLSIEANVIIAGLEGIATGWIIYVAAFSQDLLPAATLGSQWEVASAAVYAVYALLSIVVAGLVVEGVAGCLETLIRRSWWGPQRGKYWRWYAGSGDDQHARAQRQVWNSEQAYRDFSRRRLRILVCRNTGCCCLVLTLVVPVIFVCQYGLLRAAIWLLVGIVLTALFAYLWVDARAGLRNDVALH